MRLADDYYLIVHDDRSGQLTVTPQVAGLGLAAALIGELLLSGHLTVRDDGLYPGPTASWPDSLLGARVLRVVSDLRQDRLAGGWVRFLALDALADVRDRLLNDGVLTRQPRGLLSRRISYPPVNSNDAAWAGMRLARHLSQRETLSVQDATLVGIVMATGLLDEVLWDPLTHAGGRGYASTVRACLLPPMLTLLAHTEACVANAVLTRR